MTAALAAEQVAESTFAGVMRVKAERPLHKPSASQCGPSTRCDVGALRGAQASTSRSLTPAQAREIRNRHASGVTQSELAAEFEVTQQTVSNIVRGKTYRED